MSKVKIQKLFLYLKMSVLAGDVPTEFLHENCLRKALDVTL